MTISRIIEVLAQFDPTDQVCIPDEGLRFVEDGEIYAEHTVLGEVVIIGKISP